MITFRYHKDRCVTRCFKVEVGEGVEASYGVNKAGRSAIQTLRFDPRLWTRENAKAWARQQSELELAERGGVMGQQYMRVQETFGFGGTGPDAGRIDRSNPDQPILRDIKLCGWDSLNGRNYRKALHAAAPLYEGAYFSRNHPAPDQGSVPVESRFGQCRNVRATEDGLRGDLAYNPKSAWAGEFEWWVEHCPGAIAASHRVNALGQRNAQGVVDVLEIQKVLGIELVSDGGTNRGLFEALGDKQEPETMTEQIKIESLTVEQLKAQNPGLVEALRRETKDSAKAADDLAALQATLKEEKDARVAAEKKLQALEEASKAQERRAELRKACIETHKLPETAITETFLDTLVAAKTDDDVKKLVEDRLALVGTARPRTPGVTSQRKDQALQGGKTTPPWEAGAAGVTEAAGGPAKDISSERQTFRRTLTR